MNLEDPALVERHFELFHGTADDSSLPEAERRPPAGVALRARLLSLFCRSVAAANCFPHSLTVRGCAGTGGWQAAGARRLLQHLALGPPPCVHCVSCRAPPQTVTVCLYGQQTTPRLRQGGMEFAVWLFKHAEPSQLAPAAAHILEGTLNLLDDGAPAAVLLAALILGPAGLLHRPGRPAAHASAARPLA